LSNKIVIVHSEKQKLEADETDSDNSPFLKIK